MATPSRCASRRRRATSSRCSSANLSIGSAFHQIKLAAHKFDEVYRMLQTEKPLYFSAYETGTPPIRFAGFSTSAESVGEGLVDSDA